MILCEFFLFHKIKKCLDCKKFGGVKKTEHRAREQLLVIQKIKSEWSFKHWNICMHAEGAYLKEV
jgi:hypothetical protein